LNNQQYYQYATQVRKSLIFVTTVYKPY